MDHECTLNRPGFSGGWNLLGSGQTDRPRLPLVVCPGKTPEIVRSGRRFDSVPYSLSR